MSTNMLDWALRYARNGWAILPLKGKIPRTAHGVEDATTDLDTIRAWWSAWPDANIGARVDPRLVVLDIDPRNGGSTKGLPLAPTLSCMSGRGDGGMHLYYLRPPGPLSSARLPKGIDVKINGYCVVPPSIHPDSGQSYWWVEADLVELPPDLRERMRPQPVPLRLVSSGSHMSSSRLVEFVARQPYGQINDSLYWAACRAAEDGTLDEVASDLVNAAACAAGDRGTEAGRHQSLRTVESARGRCAR